MAIRQIHTNSATCLSFALALGCATAAPSPAWLDGEDIRFPREAYLCAAGSAEIQSKADEAAYVAVARVFSTRVSAQSEDFMRSVAGPSVVGGEFQRVQQLLAVETTERIEGVEIRDRHQGPKRSHALACVDRESAARRLREKLTRVDRSLLRQNEESLSTTGIARIRTSSRLLALALERNATATQLAMLDASETVPASPVSVEALRAVVQDALQALPLRLTLLPGAGVTPEETETLLDTLRTEFTALGYALNAGEAAAALDVAVKMSQKPGRKSVGDLYMVRSGLSLRATDSVSERVVASVDGDVLASGATEDEARRRSLRKLKTSRVQRLCAELDHVIRGTARDDD